MTSAEPHPGPPHITEERTAAPDGPVFELFARARVFCALPEQAPRMGESGHAPSDTVLTQPGEVLTGRADLYPGLALLEKMDISL
ncbi:hypothetical protein [Streptomyces sp. NPDC003015]